MPSGNGHVLKLPIRTTTVVVSLSVGFALIGYCIKRWLASNSRASKKPPPTAPSNPPINENPELSLKPMESGRTSRARCTPSFSERGSTRQSIRRGQSTVLPGDADLLCSVDICQDLLRVTERSLSALELVKNRSEKDKMRADLLSSAIDRLRVLETDFNRLASECVLDEAREDGYSTSWSGHYSGRPGTLSVFSDDSFMSALEDMPVMLEEEDRDLLDINDSEMILYLAGLDAAQSGQVTYRKARIDLCQCENEVEFAAKLWCLRQAFQSIFFDEHKRLWLAKAGRTLLGDLLRHSKQDPKTFYEAFDKIMDFFSDDSNLEQMKDELSSRGVREIGFWDVVLDFVLLDSFEDLKQPPSAIYTVTKNVFLSHSMKLSTLTTVVWSMSKAKRQRLKFPNGFISHFYNISEAVIPSLALGFLGTDEGLRDLCQFFREQVIQLVVDVFNKKRVRYTTVKELSEDIWVVIQNRTEALQNRIGTELIPA
ncbi:unnamed protein product [Auanema sp. JU1783]|nr:unnamed protein product [Auanema sp. JU1783]